MPSLARGPTVTLAAPNAVAIVCIVGLAVPSTQLALTDVEKRELLGVAQPVWRRIRDRLGI